MASSICRNAVLANSECENISKYFESWCSPSNAMCIMKRCDVIHWRYYDVFVYTFSSDVMCAIVASPMILWGVLLNQILTEDYFTLNCSIDYFTKIFNVNCPGDNAMNKFESRAGMLRWNKALWLVRNSHGIWISQSVIT